MWLANVKAIFPVREMKCCGDFTFKLIAVGCLLIILADVSVLQQVIEKESFDNRKDVNTVMYKECLHPQMQMKLVFTGYAIFASSFCFLLTLMVIFCDESSEYFNRSIKLITHLI